MIFVDSNVPMYMVGNPHPNKKRAIRLTGELLQNGESSTIGATPPRVRCMMTASEASPPRDTRQREPDLPDELAARFRQIARLEENWNGHGAPPVDPECIADAIRVIKIGLAMGLPAPDVALGGDGGIRVEWWDIDRWELSIDLVPGVQNTYALDLFHSDGAIETSDGAIENDDQIHRIIGLMV